jgi:hypothetical protein
MMDRALWLSRKNYLCSLIKQVSDSYGGDEIDYLKQHCRETLEANPGESIEDVIITYTELLERIKKHPC